MMTSSPRDSLKPSDIASGTKVRMVGAHPDLLSRSYKQLRRLPPAAAYVVGWSVSHHHRLNSARDLVKVTLSVRHVLFILILVGVWNAIFQLRDDICRWGARVRFICSQSIGMMWGTFFCALVLGVGKYVLRLDGLQDFPVTGFAVQCLVYGFAVVLVAACAYEMAYRLSGPSLYLIVGSGVRAIDAYSRLQAHGERRGTVLGFVDTDQSRAAQFPAEYLGSLDRLEDLLATNPVEMVYLTLPLRSHYSSVQEAIWTCERLGVNYCCSPDIFETSIEQHDLVLRDVKHAVRGHEDVRLSVKWALDLMAASVLLALLTPVMIGIAIAIKCTSPGPVFFVQSRYGKNRRKFAMFKFRSMVADAEHRLADIEHANEAVGPIFKVKEDPRVTPLGRWLRRLSLDELPQLLNVIKGEMSLVGPRPMSIRDVHRFSEPCLMRRFSVTPGMTGLWQVSGRSNLGFESWIKLDMEYIDQWTLALDLKILLRTVRTVLLCEGAQ